jgi:hypothetical protein
MTHLFQQAPATADSSGSSSAFGNGAASSLVPTAGAGSTSFQAAAGNAAAAGSSPLATATSSSATAQASAAASAGSDNGANSSATGSGNLPQGSIAPGYFHLSGTTIITPAGQPYIPLGVTVAGLASEHWPAFVASDMGQIDASADFWHANMVRLQVAPYFVDTNTAGYLAAVQQEVGEAESKGLNVIISAQYQLTNWSLTNHVVGPDASTLQFWQVIAQTYANDPHVWFELFNEPTQDRPYAVWRNGGTGSDGRTYIGMQQLVDAIRTVAPNNMIVAESIDFSQNFAGIGAFSLNGDNIVYAVHPYFHNTSSSPTQPVAWWQNQWTSAWGSFAATHALMITEWGEFEANKDECQLNAADLVPAFLHYVSGLRVGLIGWSLTPGAMIRGSSLTTPNAFDPGVTYECAVRNTGVTSQGAGQDLLTFFSRPGQF